MKLVERQVINRNHAYWREADALAFKLKNLYNRANYLCRQQFLETGNRYTRPTLYHLVKDSESYRDLPTQVSKQIIKKLVESWKSYVKAQKDWLKHPDKYKSEPRIPRYKDKVKGRNIVIYHHFSIYKADRKQGRCHLSTSSEVEMLTLQGVEGSMSNISVPTKVENIAEARIVPSCNCYILEIVYEVPEVSLIKSEWVAGIPNYPQVS